MTQNYESIKVLQVALSGTPAYHPATASLSVGARAGWERIQEDAKPTEGGTLTSSKSSEFTAQISACN